MADSPSQPRPKRQKVDKQGRFAALEKLKALKSKGNNEKHHIDLSDEVDNLYDVVDEKEYVKRNQSGNNWIEDDGTGYFEDGRDLFEDEASDGEDNTSKSKGKKSKKRQRDDSVKVVKGKGSIRNLFSNAVPKKKKEIPISSAQDDVLADILGELDTTETKTANNAEVTPKPNPKNDKEIAKEYMQNFMNSIKSKAESKNDLQQSSDDEMIERILKPKKVESNSINKIVPSEKNKDNQLSIVSENHTDNFENDCDLNCNDMDYSVLNDDENQFDEIETVKVSEKCFDNHENTIAVKPDENLKNLLNDWEKICNIDNFDEDIQATSTTLNTNSPSVKKLPGDSLKFFYWDAWEDAIKRPGEIFLFGKINVGNKPNEFKSVCVHVENVDRVLYLLPRIHLLDPITKEATKKEVTLMDVYKEFEEKISKGLNLKSFRTEKVKKNFAFHVPGVDVPETCEYIEVRYEGKSLAPTNKKIYDSISHIFGTNTSFLETFLLERKIKGPCWLNVNNCRIVDYPLSWCKMEVICSSPLYIKPSDDQKTVPPPLSLITLNIRSALNLKTHKNEILMISCLVNNSYYIDKPPTNPPFKRHFCGFTRPVWQNWPLDLQQTLSTFKATKITKHDSERALLSWFLATFQSIDPDLVVTHDVNDLQLDLLCDRLAAIKIPMWSRLGRLKVSQIANRKFKEFFTGRLICDVKSSAEELIKSRSYDLDTLCTTVLKLKEGERINLENDDITRMYETSEGITKLITITMQDSSYILKIMCEMNVLPLALQITNICGNLMARTLQGGRSERNEFLLLHAFHEKDYIVPDKKKRVWDNDETVDINAVNTGNNTTQRKKAAYLGGLVLDPIKGFYDKYILLMDFNSLYPSIIQEYNICFTTVIEPGNPSDIPAVPESNIDQGILPRQIRRLVESRREVKKLMSTPDLDPDLKLQYNIRQLALKLTANSMYGCLGFAQSRFFAQYLASMVTAKGREILMNTKNIVQKLNFQVIYGDTDSIMINTNSLDYDQVFKIGHSIKQTVNKTYRQIELDVDGVYKNLLLLKKKKYAAVNVSKDSRGELIYKQEHKGLDIVRRDWSQISVIAGKVILDRILSDCQLDEKIDNIHSDLEKFKEDILNNAVKSQLFNITKQITKPLRDYSNAISLPHVTVAKRMNEKFNKRYKKGDMVSYIICVDGTDNAAMQRAYHLDELVNNNQNLKIDTQYYLSQQLHPVVFRLCEPLEGTDSSRIATCLGLDPSKFKAAAQKASRDEAGIGIAITKTNLQKYRQCEKFIFKCVKCKQDNIVASAFKPLEKSYISVLQKCSNNDCETLPYQYILSIRNQMILSIRKFIKRFYDNWMICDEPTCNTNIRILTHVLINNRPICIRCKQGNLVRSYSERDLYHQISYYHYMFDLSKHEQKNINVTPEIEAAYNLLKETIENLLEKSAYCSINLNKLFGNFKSSHKSDLIVDKTFQII